LLQQLETKDLQIKTKDDQLAAKDEQIVNLGERLRESHFLLKEEQKLHAQVLERKRPLLSFRTKRDETNVVQEDGSQPNVIQEEGSRPSRVWRIAAAAGIGFSVLAVLAAAIFYFV
jgi:hypothetical protein